MKDGEPLFRQLEPDGGLAAWLRGLVASQKAA
jgi:hypothetical protein